MRELGEHAAASHADLAATVAASVDLALLVGPEMKAALAPALEGKVTYQAFDTVKALLAQIDTLLVEGDVVLLKGSQNTLYLERVTEYLLARAGDAELLPRRGARWDAIRATTE
jgi:UDP-N-acetylmuramyl pentapeptide synthase